MGNKKTGTLLECARSNVDIRVECRCGRIVYFRPDTLLLRMGRDRAISSLNFRCIVCRRSTHAVVILPR